MTDRLDRLFDRAIRGDASASAELRSLGNFAQANLMRDARDLLGHDNMKLIVRDSQNGGRDRQDFSLSDEDCE